MDSPIYDWDGNFLAGDSEGEIGEITIMNKIVYNELSENGSKIIDHQIASTKGLGLNQALKSGVLSFAGLSNISTHQAILGGINLEDIYGYQISIVSNLNRSRNMNDIKIGSYNLPDSYKGVTSAKNDAQTMWSSRGQSVIALKVRGAYVFNGKVFGGQIAPVYTHSGNMRSALVGHEYEGHHKINNAWENKAYLIQSQHPTFSNVTEKYRERILRGVNLNR